MPAPRSWTRMVMASRLGTGLDDLEVHVGDQCADQASRSTAATSSTATTACGLPTLRWATGRTGSNARRRPSPPARADRRDRAHVDAGQPARLSGPGPNPTVRGPAAVLTTTSPAVLAGTSSPGLDQAADAVAAHLGLAPVGVVEHHARPPRRRRARRAPAAWRRAGRPHRCRGGGRTRSRARSSHGRVGLSLVDEGHEEVVAEAVVLGERQRGHRPKACTTSSAASSASSSISHPANARVAPEPPLLADGEAAGAGDRQRRSPRPASAARSRCSEQLPVAERLGGGARQTAGPVGQGLTSARKPASSWTSKRSSMRRLRTGRGHRRPIWAHIGRAGRP